MCLRFRGPGLDRPRQGGEENKGKGERMHRGKSVYSTETLPVTLEVLGGKRKERKKKEVLTPYSKTHKKHVH